jgi:mannosyltransferase OCH1-like enzyme
MTYEKKPMNWEFIRYLVLSKKGGIDDILSGMDKMCEKEEFNNLLNEAFT